MEESDVKTVLVVGCGYIGLPFARIALAAGWQVFATTRKSERLAKLAAEGLQSVLWNVLEGDKKSLPSVDVVVYCVGYDRSTGVPMREVYVDGLRRTLEGLSGTPTVIYASSTGVYGDAAGEWVDETSTVDAHDAAAEACLAAEQTLQRGGHPWCILRFAGLYGPRRLIGADAMKRGEPVAGDGAAWLNLVHQSDAASAIWKAVQVGKSGEVYNISDGNPVRRRDFYLKLAELLDCAPPVFAPEIARRQRGNRRVSVEKAKTQLGWTPRYPSFVEGLEATVCEDAELRDPL